MSFQRICILILFQILLFSNAILAVARYAIKSVSARSVVIEMVDVHNVSRFDMRVLIYDLEKLREFRRSELTGARYKAQLFTFDGLIPNNWFAFRIEYRLIFGTQRKNALGTTLAGAVGIDLAKELSTKQEFVVKTRPEVTSAMGPISTEVTTEDNIQDEVVKFDRVQLFPELHQMNVTLLPTLRNRPRINTLVVAELRCARGTVKPPAQQLPDKGTIFSFDLRRVHAGTLRYKNALSTLRCMDLCIFPFIRVEPPQSAEGIITHGHHQQQRHTFRARELCESLQEEDPKVAAMSDKKWPAAAADELQQKLLERHFRSSTSAAPSAGIFFVTFPLSIVQFAAFSIIFRFY